MRKGARIGKFWIEGASRRIILLGAAILIFATVGFVIGTRFEANDHFCASCHVEPERSYYLASLKPDESGTLAAFHAINKTRCIDCHSRVGIPGRIWAQIGGLQNLLAYRSGEYRDPSVTTRPVGDGGCAKCHLELTWVSERPGHYHSPELRRRWRSAEGPENTCEACHPSHVLITNISDRFVDADKVEDQCEACHEAIGIGEEQ